MLAHSRTARRAALVALGSALGAVLVLGAPASGHVRVDPAEAVQGGFARLAFQVPNESDSASTTKLEIRLPEDAPVASVSTAPVPGWTVAVQRRRLDPPVVLNGAQVTEVVSVLTWTAVGDSGIRPGQFQEFAVSLGPLPKVNTMVFKTLQTYSDGTITRWIELPNPDGTEPENPAPTLVVKKPDGVPTVPHGHGDAEPASGGSSGAAVGFGIAGLVAGLGGLVLGAMAYVRSRRPHGLPIA